VRKREREREEERELKAWIAMQKQADNSEAA
jgi:hypothetical protein